MDCRIHGEVSLGNDVMMGPECVLVAQNHQHELSGVPFIEQAYVERPIRIGNNVWLGTRVIVLPGVEIGDDCVIGAGTVVSRDVPPGSVVVGSRQTVIRCRAE